MCSGELLVISDTLMLMRCSLLVHVQEVYITFHDDLLCILSRSPVVAVETVMLSGQML